MSNNYNAKLELVFSCDSNLDLGEEYVENYYAKSTVEANRWENGGAASRHAVMGSDRAYLNPDTNIMMFQATPGVIDPVNDYYCVALGPGFSIEAAKLSGNDYYVSGKHIGADEKNWGYTFLINFVDDNGNTYRINAIFVDTKNPDDEQTGDLFRPHTNGFLEFITSYDETGYNNTKGFSDTNLGRDDDNFNLDYDKLFGGSNVRVDSVYAYKNGWMFSGNYADGYTINTEIDGIPITSDGITMTPEDYKKETIKQSIIKSVIDCDMPDDIKEAMICRTINEVCDEIITKEEYERLLGIYESNKLVESEKTINSLVTYAKANVSTARVTRYDPLILDLDGDGFNIEAKKNGTNFDLDKNGFAEKINWTKRDGFLCLDLNGNGTIDNGGELFGDKTLLADGTAAKNGFEALAQYDSNGDGIIDENDEIFSSLRVWTIAERPKSCSTQWTS